MKPVTAIAWASLLAVAVSALAEDSTTQPSDVAQKISATRTHIVAPFNLLGDLTEDQKSQIRAIHAQTLLEERELHDKERDEITAVLTDSQKKELDDIEARSSADKKAAAAQRRADSAEKKAQQLQQQADAVNASTTQPSGAAN
jgi:Spy/CpxP family protein refolding chaperone